MTRQYVTGRRPVTGPESGHGRSCLKSLMASNVPDLLDSAFGGSQERILQASQTGNLRSDGGTEPTFSPDFSCAGFA